MIPSLVGVRFEVVWFLAVARHFDIVVVLSVAGRWWPEQRFRSVVPGLLVVSLILPFAFMVCACFMVVWGVGLWGGDCAPRLVEGCFGLGL